MLIKIFHTDKSIQSTINIVDYGGINSLTQQIDTYLKIKYLLNSLVALEFFLK